MAKSIHEWKAGKKAAVLYCYEIERRAMGFCVVVNGDNKPVREEITCAQR
jgi:hypothetical protein